MTVLSAFPVITSLVSGRISGSRNLVRMREEGPRQWLRHSTPTETVAAMTIQPITLNVNTIEGIKILLTNSA